MENDDICQASKIPEQEIMVSIVCITYNQEAYLAKTLESFIAQKTSFPIEIIVHDDASTDGTADILRSYENKYPNLFTCIYQDVNQYSKGVHIWADITFPKARGKYIALCEGDDYWTDPLKLQKQVNLLEDDIENSICFHNAQIVYEDNSDADKLFCVNIKHKQVFKTNDIILKNWFCPTASILFRKTALPVYPEWARKGINWDLTLHLLLSTSGNSIYIDEVMSVYRKNAINSLSSIKRNFSFHRNNLITLFLNFNKHTNYKHWCIILYRVLNLKYLTIKDILVSSIYQRFVVK